MVGALTSSEVYFGSEASRQGLPPTLTAERNERPDMAGKQIVPTERWIKLTCAHCGVEFHKPPSQAHGRQCCSRACKGVLWAKRSAEKRALLTFYDLWKMAIPEPNSGCLLWMGSIIDTGYGRFRRRPAHAVAYELAIGPLPEGMEPDHLCRVRCCIEPTHLEAVTHKVNLQRSPAGILARVGRLNLAKTHCPQGHPYAGDNLFIHKRGARSCRTCMRDSTRRQRSKRKAA